MAKISLSVLADHFRSIDRDTQVDIYNDYAERCGYPIVFDNSEDKINEQLEDLTPYDLLQFDHSDYSECDYYFTYDNGELKSFDDFGDSYSPFDVDDDDDDFFLWLLENCNDHFDTETLKELERESLVDHYNEECRHRSLLRDLTEEEVKFFLTDCKEETIEGMCAYINEYFDGLIEEGETLTEQERAIIRAYRETDKQ